VIGCNLQHHE